MVKQESRKPKELEIGNTHVLSPLKRGLPHSYLLLVRVLSLQSKGPDPGA